MCIGHFYLYSLDYKIKIKSQTPFILNKYILSTVVFGGPI